MRLNRPTQMQRCLLQAVGTFQAEFEMYLSVLAVVVVDQRPPLP